MNEGIFPSKRTSTLPGMEEERRLAFVAMTRAREGLYLSGAEGWNFDGSPRYPSRFLLEIDPALLVFVREPRPGLAEQAKDAISQRTARLEEAADCRFAPGQRVRHSVFGPGAVLSASLEQRAYLIQFDGMGTPRSIAFRAKLEAE